VCAMGAEPGPFFSMTGVIVAVLLSVSTAVAGPFEDGEAAFQRGDFGKALKLLRPLAEQGNANAQEILGLAYSGGAGVVEDEDEAVEWYRKAGDQGVEDAQAALGSIYERQGNYVEAAKWLRKAADQGNEFAQFDLGSLYAVGHGVPQDYALAHMWFNLAASHGEFLSSSQDPSKARDELASKMTPDQIAEAQRMAREWKPTK
jgi:TPR repeat protein